MAQRKNYWSCSPFADWLRGTEKGGAKTSKEWREWREKASKSHPIRYWIAEEALDKIQNFIWWPVDKLYEIKYYVNNRWITRTHCLTAHRRDIEPGSWCDVGNRFLPCLFNELVDFVEIELAWSQIAWSKDERQKYNPPFWATGWFRWRTWRCPQAGLDNLEWQRSLVWTEEEVGADSPKLGKPTYQAVNAQEILELYKWWTEVYPKRPDPHDAGGWTAYFEMRLKRGDDILDFEDRTPEEQEMANTSLDKTNEIEKAYNQEDEEMLIRLIRIRNSLWT